MRKLRKFDTLLHPRGSKGRFRENPDAPSLTGRQSSVKRSPKEVSLALKFTRKKPLTRRDVRGQSRTLRDIKTASETYKARLEFVQSLNREQRQRLQQVLAARKPEPVTPAITNSAPTVPGKPKKRKLPPLVPAPKITLVRFGDKIEIWKDSPHRKFDPSFKVRKEKDYEYKVTHKDSTEFVLNRHTKIVMFKGETVKGVPSLSPKLAEMKPEALFKALADYMSYVELPKGSKAPAPQWKPTFMGGKVPDEYLYASKGKKSYLGAEIHHQGQWARGKFLDIVAEHQAGKLTLEEAKYATRALLFKEKTKNKAGVIQESWQIKPLPISERNYVILAGGTHRAGAPLYEANHPLAIDVDSPTLKFKPYGIPKRGRAGRDWYANNFQNPFWREVYKREAYIIHNEINKRILKGTIDKNDAKKLWVDAVGKVDKQYQYVLSLKKDL